MTKKKKTNGDSKEIQITNPKGMETHIATVTDMPRVGVEALYRNGQLIVSTQSIDDLAYELETARTAEIDALVAFTSDKQDILDMSLEENEDAIILFYEFLQNEFEVIQQVATQLKNYPTVNQHYSQNWLELIDQIKSEKITIDRTQPTGKKINREGKGPYIIDAIVSSVQHVIGPNVILEPEELLANLASTATLGAAHLTKGIGLLDKDDEGDPILDPDTDLVSPNLHIYRGLVKRNIDSISEVLIGMQKGIIPAYIEEKYNLVKAAFNQGIGKTIGKKFKDFGKTWWTGHGPGIEKYSADWVNLLFENTKNEILQNDREELIMWALTLPEDHKYRKGIDTILTDADKETFTNLGNAFDIFKSATKAKYMLGLSDLAETINDRIGDTDELQPDNYLHTLAYQMSVELAVQTLPVGILFKPMAVYLDVLQTGFKGMTSVMTAYQTVKGSREELRKVSMGLPNPEVTMDAFIDEAKSSWMGESSMFSQAKTEYEAFEEEKRVKNEELETKLGKSEQQENATTKRLREKIHKIDLELTSRQRTMDLLERDVIRKATEQYLSDHSQATEAMSILDGAFDQATVEIMNEFATKPVQSAKMLAEQVKLSTDYSVRLSQLFDAYRKIIGADQRTTLKASQLNEHHAASQNRIDLYERAKVYLESRVKEGIKNNLLGKNTDGYCAVNAIEMDNLRQSLSNSPLSETDVYEELDEELKATMEAHGDSFHLLEQGYLRLKETYRPGIPLLGQEKDANGDVLDLTPEDSVE
jgi:hypothetical protein